MEEPLISNVPFLSLKKHGKSLTGEFVLEFNNAECITCTHYTVKVGTLYIQMSEVLCQYGDGVWNV